MNKIYVKKKSNRILLIEYYNESQNILLSVMNTNSLIISVVIKSQQM